MNLSAHFTLAEFIHSDTALRLGLDNDLPAEPLPNARATAQMLERIRSHLTYLAGRDVPIQVTSGFRGMTLNQRIGSSGNSDHVRAMAADFRAPAFGTPLEICRALEPVRSQIGIGQLIHEHAWVHVSTRKPENPVNAVLTLRGTGYETGIHA